VVVGLVIAFVIGVVAGCWCKTIAVTCRRFLATRRLLS
jgi:uncharacterized membrane protein YdbT with pleckstrin-like domain